MNDAVIILQGTTTSLVLEPQADGAPRWRWWGPRVDAANLPRIADARPAASFSLDIDQPLTVVPAFGAGWFGPAALRAHRAGRHFAHVFETVSIVRQDDALTITLADHAARLTIVQRIAIAGDVVTLSAEVVNDGDDILDVDWLAAATVPLPADCADIRSFTGRHNAEFVPQIEPMPAHAWVRENRRGLTGHAGPPGLFVTGPATGWHGGRVHAAQLAWSGNHRIAVDRDDDGVWTLQMGEALAPGEIRLAPGGRYESPAMLATCSTAGLNGVIPVVPRRSSRTLAVAGGGHAAAAGACEQLGRFLLRSRRSGADGAGGSVRRPGGGAVRPRRRLVQGPRRRYRGAG